ncbi:MAG: 4-hydroxyphenylpyruvate dioxygenase [Acidobacteria bacterium]|nr:4-hydroxyphenylpyruvate dioxygenase [Acidobacteriota bacterium]
MVITETRLTPAVESEVIRLHGIDYVELYVGNAYHAAHFYRTMFGFQPVACSGLETGDRDRASFVMRQGNIRLVLTSAISPESAVAAHVSLHGDGVKDIAFRVDDASAAFDTAVRRGAVPVLEPSVSEDGDGRVTKATIAACGQTVHSFVTREGANSLFFPHYRPATNSRPAGAPGLTEIDHVAISVEAGALDRWVEFYECVLGFHRSHEEDISTEHSAMISKVVQSRDGQIKFPMMEPAPGRRKSQIDEYLTFHRGPGVQHLAFLSDNIGHTAGILRENGVEFLSTPAAYYSMLEARVGGLGEELQSLQSLGLLVDRDEWGYLKQVFTRPVQSRPTLFVEIIERVGARGFGAGNIKALFEAVEREQAMRGNL